MTQDNPRMGDLNELVQRLGTPHTLDIRDIVQVRALLDLVAVERSEAAAAITSLIAERDGLREALKPFASKMDWPLSERDAGRQIFCEMKGSGSGASFGLAVDDFRRALTSLDTNKGDGE